MRKKCCNCSMKYKKKVNFSRKIMWLECFKQYTNMPLFISTRYWTNMDMKVPIYRQHMHIVSKYIIYFKELYRNRKKTSLWHAFPSCFKASTNKFYISWQYTVYCVYTAMSSIKQKSIKFTQKKAKHWTFWLNI
jgi:hypothetical protein